MYFYVVHAFFILQSVKAEKYGNKDCIERNTSERSKYNTKEESHVYV